MVEVITRIASCEPVPYSDRTRITLEGSAGAHVFELTQEAVEGLLPGLLSQPRVPGQETVGSNAISPVGCMPFESRQGLCGLAFNLGDRSLHIAVPPNGVEHVRLALDAIATIYAQKKTGP